MPAITKTAPGKAILAGEHAVVYGQPAIAVPVEEVRARAIVRAAPGRSAGEVRLQAPAIGLEAKLADLAEDQPLAAALRSVFHELEIEHPPAFDLRVTSTIPVAAGLGSGAAVSVAVIRATAEFLGRRLADEQISRLAYEVEKLHHGTPSGIDNTVIAYCQPVYFIRRTTGNLIEFISTGRPITLVIGDTGIPSPTSVTVGEVRRGWQVRPQYYERMFAAVGALVRRARGAIEGGEVSELGELLNENQALLEEIGVSSPEIDCLVGAARQAGALGAKLSGGGRGGNMIALAEPDQAERIREALREAGAWQTWISHLRATGEKGIDGGA
jgi:mevalonate kinase